MPVKKVLLFCSLFFTVPAGFSQNLMETYQLALDNDPLLKQALANRKAIDEIKHQNIAQMLPQISGRAESNFNRLNNKKINFQGQGVQEYYEHS